MDRAQIDTRLSELMRRSQDGDADAYRTLLSELLVVLERFLSRRIDQRETRDDICQEILMSIHSSRHTYDPSLPLLPWVHSIAHFRVIDHWRKAGRHPEFLLLEEALFDLASTHVPREAILSEAGVTEHLQALSEKQRRAIELVKQEGLSISEAARRLEMSESAVKVSIHRAIRILRVKLGVRGEEQEGSSDEN